VAPLMMMMMMIMIMSDRPTILETVFDMHIDLLMLNYVHFMLEVILVCREFVGICVFIHI